MKRLGRRTWFSIGAVWLAASLSAYWAHDIDLAPQDLRQPGQNEYGTVVRRARDLDSTITQPQNLTSSASRQSLIVPGEADKSPGVVYLPDSEGRARVEPVTYQHRALTIPVSPVWLDGGIELSP